MGNEQEIASFSTFINKEKYISNIGKITKSNFKFLEKIGRGGFSEVWKVLYIKYKKIYALKKMYKIEIIDKKCEKDILIELSLLSRIHHPFIVNIHFAFQDSDYLYLISDYFPQGDLRYQLIHNKIYREIQVKFIISNILLSLDYIHSNNIIHRDIKPENLLIDKKGYLAITDFGIARFIKKENYEEKSGTPGYMAPEVLFEKNHGFEVDFYALGVIGYELIFGKRPYSNMQKTALQKEILSNEVQIKSKELPEDYTQNCKNFINNLLKRKPKERLGSQNIQQIYNHPWLSDIDFKLIYNKKIKSPLELYINPGGNYDTKNVNYDKYLFLTPDTKNRYLNIILYKKDFEICFKNYYFYFNEFDLFDRKNTQIKNKFINPHINYIENNDINTDDTFFNNDNKNNNNINKDVLNSINDYSSTGTISVGKKGKKQILFYKDSFMDKENKELLKAEESLDASFLLSCKKNINISDNYALKKKLKDFMNL